MHLIMRQLLCPPMDRDFERFSGYAERLDHHGRSCMHVRRSGSEEPRLSEPRGDLRGAFGQLIDFAVSHLPSVYNEATHLVGGPPHRGSPVERRR